MPKGNNQNQIGWSYLNPIQNNGIRSNLTYQIGGVKTNFNQNVVGRLNQMGGMYTNPNQNNGLSSNFGLNAGVNQNDGGRPNFNKMFEMSPPDQMNTGIRNPNQANLNPIIPNPSVNVSSNVNASAGMNPQTTQQYGEVNVSIQKGGNMVNQPNAGVTTPVRPITDHPVYSPDEVSPNNEGILNDTIKYSVTKYDVNGTNLFNMRSLDSEIKPRTMTSNPGSNVFSHMNSPIPVYSPK